MIGSNTDSTREINTLMETAINLGATDMQIEEALKNTEGSNTDSRKVIGLLKLIASLVTGVGSGGEFTAEDRALLNSFPAFVSNHNTAENSHNDIRLLITTLTNRLNALADSDDITLDQLSEIVAYIKSNKDLIEAITSSKVSVDAIVNDLVTNVADRPLSASQGVVLKGLIPTLLSQLTGDSTHRTVTDAERASWNGKSNFSGKYSDLAEIPAFTLGTHTDGLVYLFIEGEPVGTGITLTPTT